MDYSRGIDQYLGNDQESTRINERKLRNFFIGLDLVFTNTKMGGYNINGITCLGTINDRFTLHIWSGNQGFSRWDIKSRCRIDCTSWLGVGWTVGSDVGSTNGVSGVDVYPTGGTNIGGVF